MTPIDRLPVSRGRLATGLLAFSLLLPVPARAQVDIESLRTQDAPEGVSGALGGDIDLETGSLDYLRVSMNARLDWVTPRTGTLVIGDGGLGFLEGDRFDSSGLLHLRHTRWLNELIGVEGFGQANYDRAYLLDSRLLGGAGVRLRIASSEWGALGAGLSLMLERERLDLPDTARHERETETWRNSTFVTARLVGGAGLVVSSTSYLQPALEDPLGDLRVTESLRLAVSLTNSLALSLSFDLRYDSDPPDDLAALDTNLRAGLTFLY